MLAWPMEGFAESDGASVFGCTPEASPRWLSWEGDVLHDFACTPQGCVDHASAAIKLPLENLRNVAVAPLGRDRVLLAYGGYTKGPLTSMIHEVRVRRGTLDAIASAPDDLLLESSNNHGLEELGAGVFAFARGDVAWVGVRAGRTLYLFRAAGDEPFAPVRPDAASP